MAWDGIRKKNESVGVWDLAMFNERIKFLINLGLYDSRILLSRNPNEIEASINSITHIENKVPGTVISPFKRS